MLLQLGELRPMIESLPVVLDNELPVKTAYWLTRVRIELEREFQPFEAARQTLVRKYAEIDENGDLRTVDNQYVIQDQKAFNIEYAELAKQEIDVKYEPITIDQLGDIKLRGTDLLKLGRLIRDEDEEEALPPISTIEQIEQEG